MVFRQGAAAMAVVVAASCIGSVTESRFEEMVRDRGGGIGRELPLRAVAALEERFGSDSPEIVSLVAEPGEVMVQVRVPSSPDDIDVYVYGSSGLLAGGRGLRGPQPVPVLPGTPPAADRAFEAHTAGLEHLDRVVDEALQTVALPDGYASQVTIRRDGSDAGPVTAVTVTDERSSVVVTFDADGERSAGDA